MISFIHRGGPAMASYRYRAAIPARELGATMNDLTADVLVFSKPAPEEVEEAALARAAGKTVIVDICDDHFDASPHYHRIAAVASAVTCPTVVMAEVIGRKTGRAAIVIADPYEYPEVLPHCRGNKALWFGHAVNIASLTRVLPKIAGPLRAVSNVPWAEPWSPDAMLRAFSWADIVILPATADYKSPNRAVEAIRQGCFVVAEPHPSINNFPGIWIGDIKEGIEWAQQNQQSANERTAQAQSFIRSEYSPKTVASAWKSLFAMARSLYTSAPALAIGTAG